MPRNSGVEAMSKNGDEAFKASPIYLAPIAISLLVGILCSAMFREANVEIDYKVTIMPETGIGPISNAIYFVVLISIGAYLMYFLLKRKIHFGVRFLIGVAVTVITFMLSFFYFDLLFIIVHFEGDFWLLFIVSIFATVMTDYFIFLNRGAIHNLLILLIGGALGAFLGITIPTLSAVFILLLLAVYDVISVYYGPVGKIASHGLENLPGVTFSFKDVHVGLGDLTFYSMLVSHALIQFGWSACIFALAGTLLGSFIAFKLLEKRGMFPGLPIPIILGLIFTCLSTLI